MSDKDLSNSDQNSEDDNLPDLEELESHIGDDEDDVS